MLEGAIFLVAICVGILVYAVRDGLSDIKHEIWELRMDLQEREVG